MDYRLRQDTEQKLQGEIGTVYALGRGHTSIALVYPNTYYVGMSNLGFQTVYGFLNACDGVCCERAFLPDPDMLDRHKKTGTPLFSLESQTPLSEFDIIAFSVSFENDYLNILSLLDLARFPLLAEDRDETCPLILLGGAITTINPEPLAMFLDLVVLGEGEPILARLIEQYQRDVATTDSKRELLEHLAVIPGVYVPSLYDIDNDHGGHSSSPPPTINAPQIFERCLLKNLDHHPAYSRILTEQTEFGNMFLLQINRGCCYKCRFCHTGYTQSPLRHLSLDVALRLARHGLQYRNRIGLVGAAVADYPYLQELCAAISSQGGKISVSSLRLSAFLQTDYLLNAMIEAGQKTVTMAPEAGTERLRKILRKSLSDTTFFDTVAWTLNAQVQNLKLYFIIGLPTETEADLEAIVTMCKRCRQILVDAAKARGTIGKLIVSVNPLVPKPFTPLQWCAMETEAKLKRKLQYLKRALQRLGNVEVIHETPKWAVWQGILARGDRKLGQILLLAWRYNGNWKKAFRELEMSPEFYVHRVRPLDEPFPWDHFNVGVSRQQLQHEYQGLFPKGSQ